jgi:hypothetical protein
MIAFRSARLSKAVSGASERRMRSAISANVAIESDCGEKLASLMCGPTANATVPPEQIDIGRLELLAQPCDRLHRGHDHRSPPLRITGPIPLRMKRWSSLSRTFRSFAHHVRGPYVGLDRLLDNKRG